MEYQSTLMCAFPPCTKTFPKLNRKKFCSGCCRVKDYNRRKKQQGEKTVVPVFREGIMPLTLNGASLPAPADDTHQIENTQSEPKKGMSLAGVGESAIGTAGVLFLKEQLIDKNHRAQLQQQMNQLLQQQALIARQLKEIQGSMLKKNKLAPPWGEGGESW